MFQKAFLSPRPVAAAGDRWPNAAFAGCWKHQAQTAWIGVLVSSRTAAAGATIETNDRRVGPQGVWVDSISIPANPSDLLSTNESVKN